MPQVKPPKGRNKLGKAPLYRPFVPITDIYYNMNQKHRGLALIFNHEKFVNNSTRRGTKKDRDALQTVLTSMGFRVEVNNDLTYEGIFNIIQAVSKMDHSQHDCLLITVLTHGELGMLYASDTIYSVRKLWCYFTDQHCPTLAGKPRIFFIQACRGAKYDDGITLYTDGSIGMYENPTHRDFLFAYATPPEYYSWRNSVDGSWFIQSLCDILRDTASDTDLLRILTLVCHAVAVDRESYTPNEEETNAKKEIPSIYSTLTKLIIFNNNNKKKKIDCCIQS